MRSRHILSLVTTTVTALVIGGGTAGAVLATTHGANAATVHVTTSPGSGIQLDARSFCNPTLRTCP